VPQCETGSVLRRKKAKVSDLSHHNAILVGVDGSRCAKLAVQWAVLEAAMRNVPLRIVHVAYPAIGAWAGGGMAPPEGFVQTQEDQAHKVVDDAIEVVDAAIEGNDRLEVSSEIVWSSPVAALVDLTKEVQMMVVGCRGQGALARGLLGSVSTALVHHAHCPVAVIHDDAPQPFGPTGAPVLVGIDGSPASELATAIAFDEASWRDVDLVALHAWSDAEWPHFPELEWSAIEATAEETLGERLAGWRERYPDARAVTPKHRSWQPCSPPTSYQPQHRYERHCTPSTFTSQKPSTRLAYYPKLPEDSRQLSKF
jgi:nucleotide-binding universal stress UspA family protein